MITAVIFDGKNYDLCERVVRTALKAKNKLGCIDGTLLRSEDKDDEEFTEANAWDMANSMLCSWILNIIDPKLRMTMAYCDIAYGMWEDLKKCYSVANATKIHQLKVAIANCKQSTNPDVGEFYSKLTKFME